MNDEKKRIDPYQLTINQHVHSAHSISKFYGDDGKVEVKEILTGEVSRLHKRAKIFCAKRKWNERAEKFDMYFVENEFHKEIDEIKNFNERNHTAISEYSILWRLRHECRFMKDENIQLSVTGDSYSEEEEDLIEHIGLDFVREDGTMPSRFLNSTQLIIKRNSLWPSYKNVKWGLLRATEGEFLVADSYQKFLFMPISPLLAFCGHETDRNISRNELVIANSYSVKLSKEYYFAKKIDDCPLA